MLIKRLDSRVDVNLREGPTYGAKLLKQYYEKGSSLPGGKSTVRKVLLKDVTAYKNRPVMDINQYHHSIRGGHANEAYLRIMAANDGIRLTGFFEKCPDCVSGKAKRRVIPKISRYTRATKFLARVFGDLSGPFKVKARAGHRYMFTLVDDFSRKKWTYLLPDKSAKSVLAALQKFDNEVVLPSGKRVGTLRTDNGKEFDNHLVIDHLITKRIIREYTSDYTPQQNAVVETAVRDIKNLALTFLNGAYLQESGKGLWGEAIKLATNVMNGQPCRGNPSLQSPNKILGHKDIPRELSFIFGSRAQILDRKAQHMQNKVVDALFLGFSNYGNEFLKPEACLRFVKLNDDGSLGECVNTQDYTIYNGVMACPADKVTFTDVMILPNPKPVVEETDYKFDPFTSFKDSQVPSGDARGATLPFPESPSPCDDDLYDIDGSSMDFFSFAKLARRQVHPETHEAVPPNFVEDINIPEEELLDVGDLNEIINPDVHDDIRPAADPFDVEPIPVDNPPPGGAVPADEIDSGPGSVSDTMPKPDDSDAVRWANEHPRNAAPIDNVNERLLRSGSRQDTPRDPNSFYNYLYFNQGPTKVSTPTVIRVFFCSDGKIKIPRSYQEALKSVNREDWLKAIRAEYESHLLNGTWKLVDMPSGGAPVTGCRWVFDVKFNVDGSVKRFKARLVCQGFSQTHGVDYFDTFSPVVNLTNMKMLLSLATVHDWDLKHLDFTTAFLNAPVEETIYMKQPPGFYVKDSRGKVLLLVKSIYGLKQAPRNFFQFLTKRLQSLGLRQCGVDPCLFTYKGSDGFVIICVYVDDLLMGGTATNKIEEIATDLRAIKCNDLGEPEQLLGMVVQRDRVNRTMRLHQEPLIKTLVSQFKPFLSGFGERKYSTPADENTYTTYLDAVFRGDKRTIEFDYRSCVGSLLYLSITTRPEIANITRFLSSFVTTYTDFHVKAACRVMKYLDSTSGLGLFYSAANVNDGLAGSVSSFTTSDMLEHLKAYSDASWADNYADATSTSGVAIYLFGNLIFWKSQKQRIVARSSMESEYIAMSTCVDEIMVCIDVMKEMFAETETSQVYVDARHKDKKVIETIHSAVELFGDNTSAICVGNATASTKRSRHINVRFHNVKQAVLEKAIKLSYVQSKFNRADIFTKCLGQKSFLELRQYVVA